MHDIFRLLPNPDERHAERRERDNRVRASTWAGSQRAYIIGCCLAAAIFAGGALFESIFVKDRYSPRRIIAHDNQDVINSTITEAEMQSLMDYNETLIYKGPPRELLWPSDAFTKEEEPYKEEIEIADHTSEETFLPNTAIERYHRILEKIPKSFRANYGLGRVYESYAYINNRTLSLERLRNATFYYILAHEIIHDGVEENIKEKLPLRIVSITEDTDDVASATMILNKLIEKNDKDPYYQYRLALMLQTVGRYAEATQKYEEVLHKWPDYGTALINFGRLMYSQGRWESAVEYITNRGAKFEKLDNSHIYYQILGDALQRLDQREQAMKYYQDAISKHIFRSIYQRSYVNIDHLTNKTWWSVENLKGSTSYIDTDKSSKIITLKDFFRKLKSMSRILRREVINVITSPEDHAHFEDVGLHRFNEEPGTIREALVLNAGYKTPACRAFPQTVRLFNTFPPTRHCDRCHVKYLVLRKGRIWPTCSPTNTVLTTHLALSVPDEVSIRVHEETRTWTEDDVLIFDGSFEHEIWNNGTGVMILLIFDMRRPDLYPSEAHSMKNYLP